MSKVWLQQRAYTRILEEAIRKMPYETGGVLMGYWGNDGAAVVTAVLGPGPNARHEKRMFVPDHKYDREQISRHYEQSGFTETYLGDWHTHPYSSAYLSNQDKHTLRKIANFKPARLVKPLMLILGTHPFELRVWVHIYIKRLFIKSPGISLCSVEIY